MNNKNLDELLKSMPNKQIEPGKKEEILQAIMEDAGKHERKKWWQLKRQSFVAIGGSFVAIFLALIIFVLPNVSAFFTGEETPVEITELEKYERAFYLPTYAPFDIHEVEYDPIYFGVRTIQDSEIVYTQEGDPDYFTPKIVYYSHTDPIRKMKITLYDPLEHGSYEEIEDYDERVTLRGGIEAKYLKVPGDQSRQMLAWEYDGLLIQIVIRSIEDAPIQRDDMIKIAESFETYKVGSADEHSFLQNQIKEFEGLKSLGEETTKQIQEILENANWDVTSNVDMRYPPNYVLDEYRIWVHPQNDRLDVINTENDHYAELGREESEVLYELITGETLGSD
ncbi:hypothetical protein [Alkalibacillus haloalkaliphilus]|uniref:hypothetical protein n=1 Tax=Alkalibacillus haloalkaliphilus TaxID=94136 RepID=UPI0029365F2F|nr:hypothetical protein [Alkalibacillus haloalkaliphilus]MDV2581554.1 hypothetical protein [Alkalibacillus haloalkaliphilus]